MDMPPPGARQTMLLTCSVLLSQMRYRKDVPGSTIDTALVLTPGIRDEVEDDSEFDECDGDKPIV
ncbi:hypothetical protein L1049_004091 [Liquidambar formosana]|uniref:Uncharacterized protein n=1 Tax=Liquidambar formosana TaxID=63359 RepID=A0AAP0RMM8_LIQFO